MNTKPFVGFPKGLAFDRQVPMDVLLFEGLPWVRGQMNLLKDVGIPSTKLRSLLNAYWFVPSNTHIYKGFMNKGNGSNGPVSLEGRESASANCRCLEGHYQKTWKWFQTIIKELAPEEIR